MKTFRRSTPKRTVTKEYGRNSFLALALWPIALALGQRGAENRRSAQELEMEKDAVEMLKRGYRVVDAQEYTVPWLSISYLKVTYERVESPAQDRSIR